MAEFDGKIVLVTGATKGLGAEMARSFATQGARVTIGGIEDDAGIALAGEIGADYRHLDVSQEADWLSVMETLEHAGGPDVIVNNAGIFKPGIPMVDLSLETWRMHFQVNLDGTFMGCKLGLRAMRGRGGAIVNIASTMGLSTHPGAAAYSTTKAAILMLTRHAAREGGPLGVRVNAVLPGAVLTDQSRQSIPEGMSEEDFVDMIAPMYPLGRIGQPTEIADAVLYLASPRSSFITGTLLNVDGGERC